MTVHAAGRGCGINIAEASRAKWIDIPAGDQAGARVIYAGDDVQIDAGGRARNVDVDWAALDDGGFSRRGCNSSTSGSGSAGGETGINAVKE